MTTRPSTTALPRCKCPNCRKQLTGWDDPWAPRGPDAPCPACPMTVPTRIWEGHVCLAPHALGGHAPPGGWCPMSKGAYLHYPAVRR